MTSHRLRHPVRCTVGPPQRPTMTRTGRCRRPLRGSNRRTLIVR